MTDTVAARVDSVPERATAGIGSGTSAAGNVRRVAIIGAAFSANRGASSMLYAVIDGKESLVFGIHETRMRGFRDCLRRARDSHDGTLESHLAVLRCGALYFLEHPDFLRMCCRAGFGWASRFPTELDAWVPSSEKKSPA